MDEKTKNFLEAWSLGRHPQFPPARIINGVSVYERVYGLVDEKVVMTIFINLPSRHVANCTEACEPQFQQAMIKAVELENKLKAYLSQLEDDNNNNN